jgi:hypothetical protein
MFIIVDRLITTLRFVVTNHHGPAEELTGTEHSAKEPS